MSLLVTSLHVSPILQFIKFDNSLSTLAEADIWGVGQSSQKKRILK